MCGIVLQSRRAACSCRSLLRAPLLATTGIRYSAHCGFFCFLCPLTVPLHLLLPCTYTTHLELIREPPRRSTCNALPPGLWSIFVGDSVPPPPLHSLLPFVGEGPRSCAWKLLGGRPSVLLPKGEGVLPMMADFVGEGSR